MLIELGLLLYYYMNQLIYKIIFYFCSSWSELVEVDVSFMDSLDECCEGFGDFVTELEDWLRC